MADEEEQVYDLTRPEVVEKYRAAAEITNKALAAVVAACTAGAKIADLCALGDKVIADESAKVYKAAKFEKGIAFPTCVSVNNCCGHFSPMPGDETALAEGDMAKVDLGTHVDGFLALAAHTIVVGEGVEGKPVTGEKADCIKAAYTAAELNLRAIKPGKMNTQVTPMLQHTVEAFGCNAVEGVTSHNIERFNIDGETMILNKEAAKNPPEPAEFKENEVYVVDVVVSTGDGKAKECDVRTTVFRRTAHEYQLKIKASRAFLSEVNRHFQRMPFSLRAATTALKDISETQQRLGLNECLNHRLLQPYPVLQDKPGTFVAQFKFTMLMLPSGALKLTGLPYPVVQTDKDVEDEAIKGLLATEPRKQRRNKKKQ
jgi:curved DNA binding protein